MTRTLPLTPATIEINGSVYRADATIWAGFRWPSAIVSHDATMLSVGWYHIDDMAGANCIYCIRPREKYAGYRFVKARNGNWVLREGGA